MWGDRLDGFGLRVYPCGVKVYLTPWKLDGRTRRLVLGSHQLLKARGRPWLLRSLAAVQAAKTGRRRDHTRASPTVTDLCGSWLALGTGPTGRPKRATTLSMDRSQIEAHIVPSSGP